MQLRWSDSARLASGSKPQLGLRTHTARDNIVHGKRKLDKNRAGVKESQRKDTSGHKNDFEGGAVDTGAVVEWPF